MGIPSPHTLNLKLSFNHYHSSLFIPPSCVINKIQKKIQNALSLSEKSVSSYISCIYTSSLVIAGVGTRLGTCFTDHQGHSLYPLYLGLPKRKFIPLRRGLTLLPILFPSSISVARKVFKDFLLL